MDRKINVYSSQYTNFYGNNQIHFPYSIASLVSYSIQDEEVKAAYDFKKTFLFRHDVGTHSDTRGVDILLCSCYSWNWEITTLLAKSIKEKNPGCLIIFGGPEVPKFRKDDFFDKYDYIDILVHGEGEITITEILKQYLSGVHLNNLDIDGTETKYKRNKFRDRMRDLDFPSPYSTGLIWDLVEKDPNIKYIVSWETNRGCPFACTFCDWGSATASKLNLFPEKRIFDEIEWFGKNEIAYIDCCDGNFGIRKDRDYSIAKKLTESKGVYGYPEKIGLTWVKTSSEKVIPIARVLKEGDLLRAVSLSVQTFDPATLKAVKRANLKFDTFESLIKQFSDEGIQSYTEMIMGLPEETVDSFKENWEILAPLDPQPTIMVWNCSVFVNAPMNDPEYIKKYGIDVFKSPTFIAHSSKDEFNVREYERMIRGTNTLSTKEMEDVYMFNWMMMVFHVFGITEFISKFYNKQFDMSYRTFYEYLMEYLQDRDSIFSKEYEAATKHAHDGYSGKGWDFYDDSIGDISWPIEEASWLRLVRDKNILAMELSNIIQFMNVKLGFYAPLEKKLKDSLIKFQLFMLNLPDDRFDPEHKEELSLDWKGYFLGEQIKLYRDNTLRKKSKVVQPDLIKWGYETIWYGRRSSKFKYRLHEGEVYE